MVEEYVKDLYLIGFILFVVPVLLILLGITFAFMGLPIDFDSFNTALGPSSLGLTGFLIMLYLSMKYYYKEGRDRKS